ncbi:hypothetical protein ABZY68_18270 [Streptomyces sp. NPDC006482]|uniref:hypothetical protein n=1 Tax=Streptomyces sp. NPDC006482 TaxID=3154306 RepID=UPI0033B63A56
MVRTRLKMAATLTVVVLALTGFQTSTGGKSGSGKSRGGDSGGGCSSSKKSNDDYDGGGSTGGSDSGADSGSGGGSGSGATVTPTVTSSTAARVEVVVVDCVKPAQKKRKGKPARAADTTATVEVTPKDWTVQGTFEITVEFKDAQGVTVDARTVDVTVEEGATETVDVAMRTPKAVDRVRNCVPGEVRERP